jgi:hypothetical protein
MKHQYLGLAGLLLLASRGQDQSTVAAEVDAVYPQAEALYFDLHRNPELSLHDSRLPPNSRRDYAGSATPLPQALVTRVSSAS